MNTEEAMTELEKLGRVETSCSTTTFKVDQFCFVHTPKSDKKSIFEEIAEQREKRLANQRKRISVAPKRKKR